MKTSFALSMLGWGAAYSMTAFNEHNAIAGLQNLDSQAIGAVYDQYYSEVYRYILYRLGDQQIAEDLASDVFVRLLEAVSKNRAPQTSLKGWLIGTASHLVTDELRKKYRRPAESLSDSLADPQAGPAQEADSRLEQKIVHDAYLELTSEQQEVLALRFGQGYSIEETAKLLGKNINAIKALQFRALGALQRKIGVEDDE